MKQYEEVFFSVLRTALWGQPVNIPEGFKDWGKVMKIAKTQALTGLVGDVMLTTPQILNSLPRQALALLQEIPLNNMAMHTTLNNTLILIVTTLREHGIDPVLLKGQGVAKYYPVPELRQCGDIDIYVGEQNYEAAHDALRTIVTEIDDKETIYNEVKHFHAKLGSVLVEVHRFADVNAYSKLDMVYQKYASEGLSRNLVPIDFGRVLVNTPADDFNVYYIFNHLWHHFMTYGVGLRQLCDLAIFLNSHNNVNEEYLRNILTEMKAMSSWNAVGNLLVTYMGLPVERVPLCSPIPKWKVRLMMRIILNEGNFGQRTSFIRTRSKSYLAEKVTSLLSHLKRQFLIFLILPGVALRQLLHILSAGFRQVFIDMAGRSR